MKCPVCHRDMNKKTDGNRNYWWQCPVCKHILGKKPEKKEEKEDES